MESSIQNGAVFNSQQPQHYYNAQQGMNATPPSSLYPTKQEPGYGPNSTSPTPMYEDQRVPQSQFPGGSSCTPSNNPTSVPYYQQPSYTPPGENASYYGTPPVNQYGNPIGPGGPQDEKGLGSTVVGGAAGGYAGHKLGGGFLGTTAGAVLGAIGMNAATHEVKDHGKKHKKHKHRRRRHGCHKHRRRYSTSSSSSSD